MSKQQAEQTSGEPGSLSAGPAVPASSEAQDRPVAASGAVSPDPAPAQGAAIEVDAAKADAAKADVAKPDAPKPEASSETGKADAPRAPGKVLIMSSGDRNWDDRGAAAADMESEQAQGMFGKRRLALAAVVALAAVAGALGGALATASVGHFAAAGAGAASAGTQALEASVARIDADIQTLKASVEHTSRLSVAQFNKTSDRLDKVEKAQAEPAAKLARLSEAVDKLRAAPPVAPVQVAAAPVPAAAAPVAAKEATGSTPTPVAAAPAIPPKVEVARLPTVEGWTLRDAANGVALIEGRRGMLEVYAGDPVPGVGRVDAIRRQDGRWVVVTSKGLIVAR